MSPSMLDQDPGAAAAALRAAGTPHVVATVVRAVSPTSARTGNKGVFTEEGLVSGWVGGSCAEPIVQAESALALQTGETRLVCITPDADAMIGREGLVVHSMTCFSGGAIEIYLEPWVAVPHLVVFGRSPVGRALALLAGVLNYEVSTLDMLDPLPTLVPERSFAVVSTHGVFDENALGRVAKLGLAYVGLVCSRRRREQVFADLAARGIAPDVLARIDAPAGLDVGAETPEEIALSILARIVAVRRGHLGEEGSEPAEVVELAAGSAATTS